MKRILIVMLLLSGCTTVTEYSPVVDFNADLAKIQSYNKDLAECRQLALQRQSQGRKAAAGAIGGVLVGAALGALGGSLYGGNTASNLHDAGLGAVVGGASGVYGATKKNTRQNIVAQCLANRGYNVLSK